MDKEVKQVLILAIAGCSLHTYFNFPCLKSFIIKSWKNSTQSQNSNHGNLLGRHQVKPDIPFLNKPHNISCTTVRTRIIHVSQMTLLLAFRALEVRSRSRPTVTAEGWTGEQQVHHPLSRWPGSLLPTPFCNLAEPHKLMYIWYNSTAPSSNQSYDFKQIFICP